VCFGTDAENTDDDDDDEGESESDDEGWITPSNIESMKQQSMAAALTSETQVNSLPVACVTTDYAMQVTSTLSCVIVL